MVSQTLSSNWPENPQPEIENDTLPESFSPAAANYATGPPNKWSVFDLAALPDDCLIPQTDVLKIIGISRTSWWRGVKSGVYPQPVRLGPRMNRWRVGTIRQLVRGQAA